MPRVVFLFAACCVALPATAVRLVSLNVHAWRDSQHEDNVERVCELLRQIDPDIVCLNEVLHPFAPPPSSDPYWEAVRSRRGRGLKLAPPTDAAASSLERLRDSLQFKHCTFGAATERGSFFGDIPFGNAILSRFPLERVQHNIMRPEPGDLTLGDQERTAEDLEARGIITAIVQLPGGQRLGVACTHLDHRSEELRAKQSALVAAAADAAFVEAGSDTSVPNPVAHILCGDLNSFDQHDLDAVGWDAVIRYYESRGWPPPLARSLVIKELSARGFEDTFALAPHTCRSVMTGLAAEISGLRLPPPTCWSTLPLFRIDWVLLRVPDGCMCDVQVQRHATIAARSGDEEVSDHRPVVVDVILA